MRRYAAHYIWFAGEIYRMHYIELDDNGLLCGIFPLEEEIASTMFLDGVLVPLPSHLEGLSYSDIVVSWRDMSAEVTKGSPVNVYLLGGIPLSAAKLGTDNGCGYGYVKRL